jgi:hypothetical protein
MRFWSKGLGERELVIDLSRGNLTREDGKVFMRGVIAEPVAWNYEVTLFEEDVRGILRVLVSIPALIYFLKNITGLFVFFSKIGKFGSEPTDDKPGDKKPAETADTKTSESAAS